MCSVDFPRCSPIYYWDSPLWAKFFIADYSAKVRIKSINPTQSGFVLSERSESKDHTTNWRQPCSTCACVLVRLPKFPPEFASMSSPGEVFRSPSNWTTCSTACASPRLFLWVLALRPYFPGGWLNALASPPKGSILPIASHHRLGRGIQGYLILFYAHAFVFQRQKCTSELPSLLVFPMISTDFTPTPCVLHTSDSL